MPTLISNIVVTGKSCPVLPPVTNGAYNLAKCDDPLAKRISWERCKVTCDMGYVLSDQVEWVCSPTRTWSNSDKTVSCSCKLLQISLFHYFKTFNQL